MYSYYAIYMMSNNNLILCKLIGMAIYLNNNICDIRYIYSVILLWCDSWIRETLNYYNLRIFPTLKITTLFKTKKIKK